MKVKVNVLWCEHGELPGLEVADVADVHGNPWRIIVSRDGWFAFPLDDASAGKGGCSPSMDSAKTDSLEAFSVVLGQPFPSPVLGNESGPYFA